MPRPIRYRARRLPDGPPAVEFQQAPGDRWFPLAPVALKIPFGWGPEAEGDEVRHLAGALLVSRVSLGQSSELIEDFAVLVARMPPQGWEMDGQTLGTVIARLVCGKPVPDGSRPNIEEQRLAALFNPWNGPACDCGWPFAPNGGTFQCLNPDCPVGEVAGLLHRSVRKEVPHGKE